MALNKIERMLSAAIGSMALLLAACGDEVTEVTQVVGMQVVEEGESMPKCNTENEGQMAYSVDSAAAYYCINRKWTSMKGEDGKDGKDGKSGSNGKNGSDGTSCTAVEIEDGYKIVCGDDSVGVVLNGINGENGEKGKNGDKGADGKNCEIVGDTNGVITLKCGDDTTTLYKAVCGTKAYDPEKQSCCGTEVYDPTKKFCDFRDNKSYKYVTIAPEGTDYSEVWMAENMNYKTENSWCGGGKDDKEGDCSKYGRLYTWAAAVGKSEDECGYGKTCGLSGKVGGVCPEGWHLPDTTEWSKLFTAVGGKSTAGKKLKSLTGWNSNGNGTDDYGFSAFPAGLRSNDGSFYNEGFDAYFWSATEYSSNYAYIVDLYYSNESAELDPSNKYYAFSVRCLKDQQ